MSTKPATPRTAKPKAPVPLTTAEMDALAARLPNIKAWVEAVEAHLVVLLESGEKLEHAYMAPKDANRKWIDEGEVCSALVALECDPDKFNPRTLLSPAKLETALGKKAFGPFVAEHTQRISSGMKLVLGSPRASFETEN